MPRSGALTTVSVGAGQSSSTEDEPGALRATAPTHGRPNTSDRDVSLGHTARVQGQDGAIDRRRCRLEKTTTWAVQPSRWKDVKKKVPTLSRNEPELPPSPPSPSPTQGVVRALRVPDDVETHGGIGAAVESLWSPRGAARVSDSVAVRRSSLGPSFTSEESADLTVVSHCGLFGPQRQNR